MLLRRLDVLRKAPRQERSSFTVEMILEAAQQLLLSADPALFHMAALARRAGVSTGTLYQYFPDRTSVLVALLERIWQRSVYEFRRRLTGFQSLDLLALLEESSAIVAELANKDHALRVVVHGELRRTGVTGRQTDVSDEWVLFFSELLGRFEWVDTCRVENMARSMVWAADGIVGGVRLSGLELRKSLFAAWKGIVSAEQGEPEAGPEGHGPRAVS